MTAHHSLPHPFNSSLSLKASQRNTLKISLRHSWAISVIRSAKRRMCVSSSKVEPVWVSRFPRGRVLAWRRAPVWKCVSEAGDRDIRPRLSAWNRDAFESGLHLPAGRIPRFPPQTLRRRQALGPKCAHCEAAPLAAWQQHIHRGVIRVDPSSQGTDRVISIWKCVCVL